MHLFLLYSRNVSLLVWFIEYLLLVYFMVSLMSLFTPIIFSSKIVLSTSIFCYPHQLLYYSPPCCLFFIHMFAAWEKLQQRSLSSSATLGQYLSASFVCFWIRVIIKNTHLSHVRDIVSRFTIFLQVLVSICTSSDSSRALWSVHASCWIGRDL